MRCRQCRKRFALLDTVFWTGPPGPPATPREVLLVTASCLSVAALLGGLWAGLFGWRTPPFGQLSVALLCTALGLAAAGVFALLYWPLSYLDWVLYDPGPESKMKAGKCPHCGHENRVWPWSG